MRKFILLPVKSYPTDIETVDYRVNVDYIARYWPSTTPGLVNVALRGTSAQGSTVLAEITISELDALVGL